MKYRCELFPFSFQISPASHLPAPFIQESITQRGLLTTIIRCPRLLPISPHRAARIHLAAKESAVDYPNLGGPSRSAPKSKVTRKHIPNREFICPTQKPDHLPALCIATISAGEAGFESGKNAWPPILDFVSSTFDSKTRHRRRRRRRPHPTPKYYKPPLDIGGKSQSYAYGFA